MSDDTGRGIGGKSAASDPGVRRAERYDRWLPGLHVHTGAVIAVLALAFGTAVLPAGSPLRLSLTLPLLCLLPGYALTTVLYPTRRDARATSAGATDARDGSPDPSDAGDAPDGPAGLTSVRRAALSLGFSLTILPIVVIPLELVGLPFAYTPILAVVSAVTLVLLAGGAYRRMAHGRPASAGRANQGWATIVRHTVASGRRWLAGDTPLDTGLNVALAFVVFLAVGSLWVGVVAPLDGTAYTETALLTDGGSGDLVAANYSVEHDAGEGAQPVLVVENHEGRAVQYGVVAVCQRVEPDGGVARSTVLSRFNHTVAAGETWRSTRNPDCSLDGDRVRLVYLIYRGAPPDDPSASNAYRTLTLWVETADRGNTTSTTNPARAAIVG